MTTFKILCVVALCFVSLHDRRAAQTRPSARQVEEHVLARFSYISTYATDGSKQPYSPMICFELNRGGHYRESRMTTAGATENLGGTLSQDQLNLITKLMTRLDFDSSGGGVIRRGSESFVVEIVRGDKATHYVWIDPDHQRPFPDSAVSIINWLRGFTAQDASPLTVPSTAPICPRMSDNPLQPVALKHASCLESF